MQNVPSFYTVMVSGILLAKMTSPYFVAQTPTSNQGRLTIEVSKLHTIRHAPGRNTLNE
jgi:hypothetical protein